MLDLDFTIEKTIDTIHIHLICACEYIEQLIDKITKIFNNNN